MKVGTIIIGGAISIAISMVSTSAYSQCEFGPDQCKAGFVWREAFPGDRVCVTGEVRDQVAADNSQAAERRDPAGGPFGPETCLQGYVWREAGPADRVCVTGQVRDQARADNSQANARLNPDCVGGPVCIDQAEAEQVPPKPSRTVYNIAEDGTVTAQQQGPLAGVPEKMWNPGQTLRVSMTGGTAFTRSRVRRFAEEWTRHANLRFVFVEDGADAEIRVGFDQNDGNWSRLGRDALGFCPLCGPTTMNLRLNDATEDHWVRRRTLHEFGHAIGLIHEHQSPAAGIAWNTEAVYRIFQANGMTRQQIDDNVLNKYYQANQTNYSEFDRNSIMLYPIEAAMTLDGFSQDWNFDLSPVDIDYIRRWYPYPGDPSGILRTGDDCDEIDFTVVHNASDVDPGSVRFTLAPGTNITWWKGIRIPVGGGDRREMTIQDGSTAQAQLSRDDMDNSRPITFGKAKFLGVPTWLPFTWDVMPALPARSHVTFSWRRDRC